MSHSAHSIHEAAPFSPLFSPSQESSPQPSMYSRSPSPTPLAHRTQHQQPSNQHRPTRPIPSQQRLPLPVPPPSAPVFLSPHPDPAYYHSEEPPQSDIDVLLSPSFSLPQSNSDNSAPLSPALSPSPHLQSPFSPLSPSHSSSASSTSGSTGGPLSLQPWQLALFHTHYPQLSQLNLSHNRLIALCSFHSVSSSLVTLNLSYNILPGSCLAHLAPLTALAVLSLAHNHIESLSSLPALGSLTSIDVSSNCLSLTSSHLTAPISRSLPQLQRLVLSGNPFCSSDREYRLTVIHALKDCRQLTWLDGLPLEEERSGLGDGAGEDESKEQVRGSGGGAASERQTGPRGTERKRVDHPEADSQYDTSAVPFPLQAAATSSLLFTSPFNTPHQSRPVSASKETDSHHLSPAPVTHLDVEASDGRSTSALTATPHAPLQPASNSTATNDGDSASYTTTHPAPPISVVAAHSQNSRALHSLPSHHSIPSLPQLSVSHNGEQDMRIAALEDELRRMRVQLRDSAATATTNSRHKHSLMQPTSDITHSTDLPLKTTTVTHFTRPLPQASEASSLPSTSPDPSPSQLSFPAASSSSPTSSSPLYSHSLLSDLQHSRRQCDDLRSKLAGLQHVISLQEQTLSARLNVDTDGLSLWRHALVQLVKKQREDEEKRERMAEEKREADRRWQYEREQKAAEVDVMRRTAEKAREELWKREDELSHTRLQQSQAEDAIQRLEREKEQQSVQLREASAGLVALRASQQSVGAVYERAERMLAATSARLHFACQRVAVIKRVRAIEKGGVGGEMTAATQLSSDRSKSGLRSVLPTAPLPFNDDSLLLRRELDRLCHDNAMLLQRHADTVSYMRSEHAKEVAQSAARLHSAEEEVNALRAQYRAAMEDNARLSTELTDARSALSRHRDELVDQLDNVRREGERQADERCERLKAELKKARDEHAALQREAVANALELRRMQRSINKMKDDNGRAEDDRWRTAEEELRRRDLRIERLEREKEDMSKRWRQMLPQSIAHQPSSSSSSGMSSSVNGTSAQQVGNSAVSAKLNSLAALSMQLLEDDSDD